MNQRGGRNDYEFQEIDTKGQHESSNEQPALQIPEICVALTSKVCNAHHYVDEDSDHDLVEEDHLVLERGIHGVPFDDQDLKDHRLNHE